MKKKISQQLFNLLFFLTVTGLLVFLNGRGCLETPKNLTMSALRPFQKSAQDFSGWINYRLDTINSIGSLKEETVHLKEENQKLLAENVKLKEVQRENDFLRKQMNIPLSKKLNLRLAGVISRDPENFGNYIIINAGKKQGVEEKQAVIVAGGILIGQITEVFDNSSKAMLLTDSQSSVSVITQQTRIVGIAKGKYGVGVLMEMVSQNEKIESGEIVITSGIGGKIPPGLVVGKVKNVEESDSEIFKKIVLEQLADFRKIEKVFVILDY